MYVYMYMYATCENECIRRHYTNIMFGMYLSSPAVCENETMSRSPDTEQERGTRTTRPFYNSIE